MKKERNITEVRKEKIPQEVKEQLESLLKKCENYLKDFNLTKIERTFYYIYFAHFNRKRKSGVAAYTHPLECTNILLENMFADEEMVVSMLLHDIYIKKTKLLKIKMKFKR